MYIKIEAEIYYLPIFFISRIIKIITYLQISKLLSKFICIALIFKAVVLSYIWWDCIFYSATTREFYVLLIQISHCFDLFITALANWPTEKLEGRYHGIFRVWNNIIWWDGCAGKDTWRADLSLIPQNHMRKGENQLLHIISKLQTFLVISTFQSIPCVCVCVKNIEYK